MISFFAFSGLLNFIISILLAILIYFKGGKKLTNKIFALDAFSVAFWSFAYFFWQISIGESSALFWSRILMVGAIFIPIFYFHFIVSFLNLVEKYKKALYGGYILSVLFLISNFTPYFVKSVEFESDLSLFWPKPGIFYHPFLLMFAVLVCYGWYLLIKTLRGTTEKIKKQQIKYLLLGTGIGFIGGSTNYFLWYGIPILPYLNITVSIYVLLTTFAIFRYHLFEIRIILTELLVGAIGLVSLIQTFSAPSFSWRILNSVIFILFCIFGYYLIKATHEEIKRREEAEKLVKEFARLDKVKNEFILSTQHHLRTPLSIMKGYVSLILEGTYGKLNQKMKEKLIFVQEANASLINLVNDFLDITQFQLGKDILNKKEVQIEDLIKEVIEGLKPEAEEKNIYLRLEKPLRQAQGKLPKIKVDPEKLKEVIFNVVDNGIKYTNQGGVTIKCKMQNTKYKIQIQDTGIGMIKEEMEKLFIKFFERGEKAKEVYATGRGIGLYIANQIIKAHNGKIWAESPGKGKGSTFYIELPIK